MEFFALLIIIATFFGLLVKLIKPKQKDDMKDELVEKIKNSLK